MICELRFCRAEKIAGSTFNRHNVHEVILKIIFSLGKSQGKSSTDVLGLQRSLDEPMWALSVPIFRIEIIKMFILGESPGLVVMGWDSCSEGRGFESQRHLLDGHDIFSHWFVVKTVLYCFFEKTENKRKRGRARPFLKNVDLGKRRRKLEPNLLSLLSLVQEKLWRSTSLVPSIIQTSSAVYLRQKWPIGNVTRLGDLLDSGQPFKAFGNN